MFYLMKKVFNVETVMETERTHFNFGDDFRCMNKRLCNKVINATKFIINNTKYQIKNTCLYFIKIKVISSFNTIYKDRNKSMPK